VVAATSLVAPSRWGRTRCTRNEALAVALGCRPEHLRALAQRGLLLTNGRCAAWLAELTSQQNLALSCGESVLSCFENQDSW
jgi:hypothetical protein